MKKMFVILLILAIAGGAFAEPSKWSISGEGEIVTSLDFLTEEDIREDIVIGGNASASFDLTFGYERASRQRGLWTVHVPLNVNADIQGRADSTQYFGTKLDDDGDSEAFIKYVSGPLTVTIPFDFVIRREPFTTRTATLPAGGYVETAPNSGIYVWDADVVNTFTYVTGSNGYNLISWGNASITAEYEARSYYFTFGINNILRANYDANSSPMTVGSVGGWYDFMNGGARLAVSYGGAVETEWFRSSDVSFKGFGFYPWENIGAELGDDPDGEFGFFADGVAYKFYITPALSVGVSFANHAITTDKGARFPFMVVDDFILNGVFGVKFDAGVWDVAAMAGWTNYWTHPVFAPGFTNAVGYEHTDGETYRNASIPVYLGAQYRISSDLTAGADLSARFLQTGDPEPPYPFDTTPVFNIGAYLGWGSSDSDGFWARAEVYALELGLDLRHEDTDARVIRPQTQIGRTLGLEIQAAFNGTWDDGWENNGDGFWAGLRVVFGNFFDFEDAGVGLNAGVGYNGLRLLDQLTLNANGYVQSIIADETFVGFRVTPELVWSLIPNGDITFGYTLGYNWHLDDNRLRNNTPLVNGSVILNPEYIGDGNLTQHQLDVTFTWRF